MIAFVRGHFAIKTPAHVIVDVNGVGYDLQISLNTYSAIADKENGQLFAYLNITENAQTLYGFAELSEKELFLQLISVSGIGAATARMMLSGMRPEEISRAIIHGNIKLLSGIKGIGKKTAERLVVELRDKLGKQSLNAPSVLTQVEDKNESDAVNALIALGINRAAAENTVKKIILSNPLFTLEDIVKTSLKNL
jgi:Holliday junction DNA helicase RuvA